MNKKNLLFAFIFIASFIFSDAVYAQKYWVKFKNKTGTPYTIGNPTAYLSAKAIARRNGQNISIDSTDLPVDPLYVSQVNAVTGVTVLFRSKWLNGIVISVTNTVVLSTINTFSFVQSLLPVNRYKVTTSPIEETPIKYPSQSLKLENSGIFNYGSSLNQANMIKADAMHYAGCRGQGITIAVLDAGFLNAHIDPVFDSLFMQGRLLGTRDFVTGDTMVFEDHYHGAACLSTMAGIQSGTLIGTAPKANYWLLRTEDAATETPSEEYNWLRGIEFADSVGADLTTTSLGYSTFDNTLYNHTYAQLNGKTSLMSIAATMASRKGIVVLNAAGNEGGGPWNFITIPSDADSIITVGAVDPSGVKAGFSSFGPTADGRIKPDLCAQGGPAWVCNTGCSFGNGTSFATPILAGSVACLLQARPFNKPMTIIQALKATASNSSSPNNNIGWGIPNIFAAASSLVWTQKASFGGLNRENAIAFSIGTKGYVGTGNDAGIKNDFWEYNSLTNTWTQKANFGGGAIQNAVAFSIGTKGYVGTGNDGSTKNDFWEYDAINNIWSQKANFGGTPRENAVGFSINGKGYIGTGNDGSIKNDFWEYDPTTDIWTQKANFGGTARDNAVGFNIGNKGYIGTGNDGTTKNDFWEYDPITDTWTQKANFGGTPRQNATGIGLGTSAYIGTGNDGTTKNDFWEYDQATNTWVQKTSFAGTPRGASVCFAIGTSAFLGTGNDGTTKNDIWEFKQVTSVIGIKEYESINSKISFTIFPNPSNGIFTVKTKQNGYQKVDIYNMEGRKVVSGMEFRVEKIIDISKEPKGIYLIKVISPNGLISSQKIIID